MVHTGRRNCDTLEIVIKYIPLNLFEVSRKKCLIFNK